MTLVVNFSAHALKSPLVGATRSWEEENMYVPHAGSPNILFVLRWMKSTFLFLLPKVNRLHSLLSFSLRCVWDCLQSISADGQMISVQPTWTQTDLLNFIFYFFRDRSNIPLIFPFVEAHLHTECSSARSVPWFSRFLSNTAMCKNTFFCNYSFHFHPLSSPFALFPPRTSPRLRFSPLH